MGSNGVMLLIIIICIILSGYFSATETAFSAINRVRIRNQAEKGDKRAALVLQLSDNYDSLLSTILIGNNIVNIGCSSLATILFVKLLGEEMGAGISTLVITVVVLIFGEISPKEHRKRIPGKIRYVFRTDDQWASDRSDTDQLDVRAVEEAVVLSV